MLGNIIKNALIAIGTAKVVDYVVRNVAIQVTPHNQKMKPVLKHYISRDASSLMRVLESDPEYIQQIMTQEDELHNSMRKHPAGKGLKSEEDVLGDS